MDGLNKIGRALNESRALAVLEDDEVLYEHRQRRRV